MRQYDPSQPLICLHIPKTGGTSLRRIFEQWFGESLHRHYPDEQNEPALWESGVAIYGHFNVNKRRGVFDSYPNASQFVATFREPFERSVSLWKHLHRVGRTELSFEAWLEINCDTVDARPDSAVAHNLPVLVKPGQMEGIFDPAFVAVGLNGRLQETADLFAALLRKPRLEVGHQNVAPTYAIDFEPFRRRHEDVFALEHELFQEAVRVFENQVQDVK